MRIKKEESGETTIYVGRYYEKNLTTGVETLYLYLGEQLVAYEVDDSLRYLHRDHLGSTAVVTDANGDVVFERTYDAWGNVRTASGTADTDRLYTSQRFDAATGLYYYNARYYDPMIGRFISPDTIVPDAGDPQAWNRYSYVLNNPPTFTDPSGHCIGRNPIGHIIETAGGEGNNRPDYMDCTISQLSWLSTNDWSLLIHWADLAKTLLPDHRRGSLLLLEMVEARMEGLLFMLGRDKWGMPRGSYPGLSCYVHNAFSFECKEPPPPPRPVEQPGDDDEFFESIFDRPLGPGFGAKLDVQGFVVACLGTTGKNAWRVVNPFNQKGKFKFSWRAVPKVYWQTVKDCAE